MATPANGTTPTPSSSPGGSPAAAAATTTGGPTDARRDADELADLFDDLDFNSADGEAIRINLYRESPRIFQGQQVSGFVGMLSPPISVEEIREGYGGGRFKIEVRRGGKYWAAKRVEVAGDPIVAGAAPARRIIDDEEDDDDGGRWEYAADPHRGMQLGLREVTELLRAMRETVSPSPPPAARDTIGDQLEGLAALLDVAERLHRPPPIEGGGVIAGVLAALVQKIPDDFFPSLVDSLRGGRGERILPKANLSVGAASGKAEGGAPPAGGAGTSHHPPGSSSTEVVDAAMEDPRFTAETIVGWLLSSAETGRPTAAGIATRVEDLFPQLFSEIRQHDEHTIVGWVAATVSPALGHVLYREEVAEVLVAAIRECQSDAQQLDGDDVPREPREHPDDEPPEDPDHDRGGEARSTRSSNGRPNRRRGRYRGKGQGGGGGGNPPVGAE